MIKEIVIFGLIIASIGTGLCLWPKQIPFGDYGPRVTETIYPYQVIGAIVALIGFTTLVIGCYIPETKK
jgi:hypothetical protein